ncbi:MAG: response regulator [Alphaproteobacteria bacterium]|nr:response regulator [Alphaproteobacteria bacterium]
MAQSVLILDDDSEFRALLNAILEPGGHEVIMTAAVSQAQALLTRRHVDLVIVDELLPDGSGLDFARWLQGETDDTAILFLASFWRDSDVSGLLAGPHTRVMQKPTLPNELRNEVEAALRDTLPEGATPGRLVATFDGVDDILSFLRDTYRGRLHERLHELETTIARARDEGLTSEETYAVLLMVHKLHGSAGSFGFFEVSAAVGRMELLFEQLISGQVAEYESFWSQLDDALHRAMSGSIRPLSDYGEEGQGPHMGRVLVADADDAMLAIITEAGRRRLIEVIAAHNAGEAMTRARENELDGLFIDIDLDEAQGGFKLARRLRGLGSGANVPIAFLSADASLRNRVAAAHAGGALFLPKPLNEDAFVEAVRRFAAQVHAEAIRVLVLHEDPLVAQQLRVLMDQDSMDVRAVQDASRILEMLDAFRPDVLIIDVVLEGISGFDVCRLLRLHPDWQDLPVLLRSAGATAEMRAAAYQAGADDFLGREIRGTELLDRVRMRSVRYRRIKERRDRDPLTGLMQRSVFAEQLAARLGEASRLDRPVSIALLEVDRFKQINDAHGIVVGDQVLSTLGKLLRARFRVEDLRARWGGAEFAIALTGAAPEDALVALEKVRRAFTKVRFRAYNGHAFQATFSAGLSAYPDDGDDVEELLRAADFALRTARNEGSGEIRRYDGP